jgi:short-subunit dehydrogenase
LRKIIVIGASSGIGRGLAEHYLGMGEFVVLCARRTDLLNEIRAVYPENSMVQFLDVCSIETMEDNLNRIFGEIETVDLVIFCSGVGDFNPDLHFETEKRTVDTNVSGFTAVADLTFVQFQKQGFGHLVAITSVGGLRGGAAAPAYNASKAYQINYLEALRIKASKLRLPVYVTDVRPGFVDTAMAKGEGLFWVCPVHKATLQITRAISQKRGVIYITRRWRWVALLLRHLPYYLYSRL